MDDSTHITLSREFLDQAAELAARCSSELARERVTVSQAVALGIRAFIEDTWKLSTSDSRSSEIKYVDILDVCDFSANGWRIEVRTITAIDEPALYVPTMPLIVGILSDFYVAAQIDPSLSDATLLGFASAQDLASADLTGNGMFAVLSPDELRPLPDLQTALSQVKQQNPERERFYAEWRDRAERIMNGLGQLLDGEGVFGTGEMTYLAERLRDDILRVYGDRLPRTGLEPLFDQLLRRFGLERPVPAAPESPVAFDSPAARQDGASRRNQDREFFAGNLNVRERASLYRDLLQDAPALEQHSRAQRILDGATGGTHSASPRRRERLRVMRASMSAPQLVAPDRSDTGVAGRTACSVQEEETSMNLRLDGPMYPAFTGNQDFYSNDDKACIEATVQRLLSTQTSADKPGMLLGKIQSGKTKTFLGVIALAFDNGVDVSIILTKGTKALTRQTMERVRREFGRFEQKDQLQIYDIMTLPSGLTGYELNQKLIFVVKKQSDNMNRLAAVFRDTYPQLAVKRALIIDDEADYASIGFKRSKEDEGISSNVTTQKINDLRGLLGSSAFLQVTATPYSLYLQPDEVVIHGEEFRPVRPAFTELVPVHPDYIGSDYYFDRSTEGDTVASFIYHPLTRDELGILRQPDRRRFKIEECLTSNAIRALREAICNFVVGGSIRRLQDQESGTPVKKFSFLVHTEASKAAHAWQQDIVVALNDALARAASEEPELLRELISESYRDLAASINVLGRYLPPLESVVEAAFQAFRDGWVMITKVNSEKQVEELLDLEGQLRLRTPLNIYIGGQILDRGVTIANLIGFFYGRRPHIYQQDTVLQHSRMFGFRPIDDLTVTRFYTEPEIYDAMRRMHESDVALRESIERTPDHTVVFIQSQAGRIVPCSPNKILVSNTTTLRPFTRILPIGFQTDYKTRVMPIVTEVDKILAEWMSDGNAREPFEMPLHVALDLLRQIQPTIRMEETRGYKFDWNACRAALEYMSLNTSDVASRGRVWCLVRKDRNLSRFQPTLGEPFFSDAPDSGQREGDIARQTAIHVPMLMMFRQNGLVESGWLGTPYYWPVVFAPRDVRTSIFAHATNP